MIDFTPRPTNPTQGSGSGSASISPETGKVSAAKQSSTTTQTVIQNDLNQKGLTENSTQRLINYLKKLPQNTQLIATVKSSQRLNQQQIKVLQQHNPEAANRLVTYLSQGNKENQGQTIATKNPTLTTQQSAQSQTASTTTALKQTSIFLNTLSFTDKSISTSSVNSQAITTLTTQALQKNAQMHVSLVGQQLNIKPTPEQTVQKALANLIKQVLPKQQAPVQLQQMAFHLTKLPAAVQIALLGKSVHNQIQQLNHFIQTQNSLSNANQVKTALDTSQAKPLSNTLTTTQANTLPSLLKQLNHSINQTLNRISQTASEPTGAPHSQIVKTPVNSNGANVIGSQSNTQPDAVFKEIERFLQQAAIPINPASPTGSAGLPTQTSVPIQHLSNSLLQLLGIPLNLTMEQPSSMQQLLSQQQLASLSQAIQQHLKQLIEKTQARIQFNQLRALNIESGSRETINPILQQFHSDLSLRFSEQILPLSIHIREEDVHPKEGEDNTEKRKVGEKTTRRWVVMMSFELPNNESLHSQLTIINNTVSTTLWAESSELCQLARDSLVILRDKFLANGLDVDDIQCIQGKPPQQDYTLGYHLVDIET